jgi:hypothetical protein
MIAISGGEVAEWFKAHAWKACVPKQYRGFESLPLRQLPPLCYPPFAPTDGWSICTRDSQRGLRAGISRWRRL